MDELKGKLSMIDSLLAKISVKGDDVTLLALARQELKKVYDLIPSESEAVKNG